MQRENLAPHSSQLYWLRAPWPMFLMQRCMSFRQNEHAPVRFSQNVFEKPLIPRSVALRHDDAAPGRQMRAKLPDLIPHDAPVT